MPKPIVRNRRYDVKPESNLMLLVETCTGQKLQLKVTNVSQCGLLATTEELLSEQDFSSDAVLPYAKLVWDEREHILGRLNVRRISVDDSQKVHVGLAAIDVEIPVDGSISFQLTESVVGADSQHEVELNPEKFSIADLAQTEDESVDLFARARTTSIFRREWRKLPQYMYETVRKPSMGPRVALQTTRKSNRSNFIVMGSNDYLGLAAHPEVINAAKQALDEYGFGSTGSPVTTGRSAAHMELCDTLAHMFRKDNAVLFNSGYTANVGAISALANSGDLILADFLSHASIQDSLRMSKATSRLFRHNDMNHLERLLTELRPKHRGAMVITEGVFSMDGDVAKLDEIVNLARKHNARTYIDEAHSFGVVGEHGLGLWEALDSGEKVDVVMGTFSKICGGIGGFIAADQEVCDYLDIFARSQVFSVSIPPSTAAAVLKAIDLFQRDKSLLQRLHENIRYFVHGMRSLGAPLNPDHPSAVIPVIIGDEHKLGIMNDVLLQSGIYVVPIVYPAVSRNASRFRFTVMAPHTQSDLDLVIFQFEKAMKEAKFRFEELAPATELASAGTALQRSLKLAS
jgi:glycine C-acetyltransferase